MTFWKNDDSDDNDDLEIEEVIIITPVKKINYLNNKDMLKEIHRSKNSFCEYIDPKYSDYDVIVEDLQEIFLTEVQEKGKIARAARLSAQAFEVALSNTVSTAKVDRPKLSEYKIKSNAISVDDLVYRVLGFDHIPLAPGRKKNPKSIADNHIKLNFFPFKHYIIENGIAKEVGLSHSKKGKFNLEHGSITNKLAKMFILMVNKYAQRGNWRGYCVDEQTEALTQRGWLNIDQIEESDIILSYSDNDLKWSKINSIYRDDFDGKMFKITTRNMDSLVTPGHKLVTDRGLIEAEYILESDKIILTGNAVNNNNKIHNDSFVELIGWIITESCYQYDKNGKIKTINIYQNPGEKANRIRKCLSDLNIKFSESNRTGKNICFYIFRADSIKIHKDFPTKNLTMEFITSLTKDQRELLINTMIDGDGWRTGDNNQYLHYTQKDKIHVDLFRTLCTISGLRSSATLCNHLSYGKETSYYTVNVFSKRSNNTNGECLNFHGGKRNGHEHIGLGKITHPNEPTEYYQGRVWCPETEYGCFMARRNDTIYLTGNTYLDEMKGQALLQLAQMGLQFDEYKSDNPFSYYTASVSNSFTRVLNLEKKNQDLRDDLLIDCGASPSFSRQLEVEGEIRRLREDAQESAKDE